MACPRVFSTGCEAYRPEHLLTTVMHTMFNASVVRANPSALPADVSNLVNNGQPISELF